MKLPLNKACVLHSIEKLIFTQKDLIFAYQSFLQHCRTLATKYLNTTVLNDITLAIYLASMNLS
jgi:hypothetical protein